MHQDYILITVVLDKKAHIKKYEDAAFHPYHYCLSVLLERYCGLLNFHNSRGDVMAESRGGEEDKKLKIAYINIYDNGTWFRSSNFFKNVLTSKEIKIKPKTTNISGLQLADLIAYPIKRNILIEKGKLINTDIVFGDEIYKAIENKFNRNLFTGKVDGYGKIFL